MRSERQQLEMLCFSIQNVLRKRNFKRSCSDHGRNVCLLAEAIGRFLAQILTLHFWRKSRKIAAFSDLILLLLLHVSWCGQSSGNNYVTHIVGQAVVFVADAVFGALLVVVAGATLWLCFHGLVFVLWSSLVAAVPCFFAHSPSAVRV